jgi:hypothetical protein
VSSSKADIIPPTSGVWTQPRAYIGTTVAPEPLDLESTYKFKTKLINDGTASAQAHLIGRVSGTTEPFYNSTFSIPANDDTIRGATFGQFANPGIYTVDFEVNGQPYLSKDFNVTPEPSALAITALGGLTLLKRKRRLNDANDQQRKAT